MEDKWRNKIKALLKKKEDKKKQKEGDKKNAKN